MVSVQDLAVVTGSFGFTGAAIASHLLSLGRRVRTLTGHPDRLDRLGGKMEVAPLSFQDPDRLRESLIGATTLYNTYWVRFERGAATFGQAVENTRTLVKAAEEAGVQRLVHISITNPSAESPLPYFRGKALVEQAIGHSTLSHAIVRPTVIFGSGSILLNNIAWLLRRLPVFVIPGSGDYRLQPVSVEDVAELAVRAAHLEDNVTLDAVGPETYTFNELVRLIADKVHSSARIIHLPPSLAHSAARVLSVALRDVLITRDEIEGLMAGLLVSSTPPTGESRFGEWLEQNTSSIGTAYFSELDRHYR